MAEHFYGNIHIGGVIPENKLDKLVEMLEKEGVQINDIWAPQDDSGDLRAYIKHCANEGKVASFEESQAAWGKFEMLEDWLVENEIDFDRFSSQFYEFSAEYRFYRAEGNKDIYLYTSEDGDPIIGAATLDQWIQMLKKGKTEDVVTQIKHYLDPVPELKPLTILEFKTVG